MYLAMNRFKIVLGREDDFWSWTKSESFKLAHKDAASHRDLYLGPPDYEGFKVII